MLTNLMKERRAFKKYISKQKCVSCGDEASLLLNQKPYCNRCRAAMNDRFKRGVVKDENKPNK